MEFREAVRTIIESIPLGRTFDSHFVINQLIKDYSDEYINFTSKFAKGNNSTLAAHGNIGQQISRFEGQLVEQQTGKSCSENIHDNPSECALWKRI